MKYSNPNNKSYREFAEDCHPLGNIGRSDDITKAALYLCSDNALFINEEILYLDGGLTIQDPYVLAYNLKK